MSRATVLHFLCLSLAFSSATVRSQEILEGVAGIVNRDVVTWSQVREWTESTAKQARETLRGQELVEKLKEVRAAAIHDLIDRALILQEFKSGDRFIPESSVDERIQRMIDGKFGGDRPAFLRRVKTTGYTLTQFRERLRDEIIVEQMRNQAVEGTNSESEAKEKEEAWLQKLRKKAYIKIY